VRGSWGDEHRTSTIVIVRGGSYHYRIVSQDGWVGYVRAKTRFGMVMVWRGVVVVGKGGYQTKTGRLLVVHTIASDKQIIYSMGRKN
jgi:hypothetical protein